MKEKIRQLINSFGLHVSKHDPKIIEYRKDFHFANSLYEKYNDFTMVPIYAFMDNLKLLKKISNIDGAVVECGVWRGGMMASMAEILGNERKYYLCDSFEGLPAPENIDGEMAIKYSRREGGPEYYDNCSAEQSYALKALSMAGCTNYKILKGWFKDTLPSFPKDEKIAVLRLDGDWYESTQQCLVNLYDKVVDDGIIIIDDYYFWEGCTKAVHDFLSERKLSDRIRMTEFEVCYIVKNKKSFGEKM